MPVHRFTTIRFVKYKQPDGILLLFRGSAPYRWLRAVGVSLGHLVPVDVPAGRTFADAPLRIGPRPPASHYRVPATLFGVPFYCGTAWLSRVAIHPAG